MVMTSGIWIVPVTLILALIATTAVAPGNSALPIHGVGASGGFQSGPGSSDLGTLINDANANYQANPESAVNIYLIPEMGETEGLPPQYPTPTPFPAFNEHYQVPDVFAAFNQAFPSTVIVSGSSDQMLPALTPAS